MNERAPAYTRSIAIAEVMPGGTVNSVISSGNPRYKVGDLVLGNAGWQELSVSDGKDLFPLGALDTPSRALGVLGMPSFTAYVGLLDIGQPKPGETVVVAAATGAVGAVVGQIAKLKGVRAIGIAGGPEKCQYAVEQLGFDLCLDHREPDPASVLRQPVPRASTSISKTLAAPCSKRCFLVSMSARASRCAASSPATTTRTCRQARIACH